MPSSLVSKAASRSTSANRVVNKDSLKTKKLKPEREMFCKSDDDDCVISTSIVVLKNKCDMRRYEESEDCFILDFDPFEVSTVKQAKQIDEDVFVMSEKGQVACRDYPHSRHLCLEFPFKKTSHESYCKLCYCYVCDTAAPCKNWKSAFPIRGHCHASDASAEWKLKRELAKRIKPT